MEYRNVKTGAVINVESEMGGNWVPVSAPPKKEDSEKKPAPKKRSTKK